MDSKSIARKGLRVRVPPPAPQILQSHTTRETLDRCRSRISRGNEAGLTPTGPPQRAPSVGTCSMRVCRTRPESRGSTPAPTSVIAGSAFREQRTHRLDDRCDGLILGKSPQQWRHRVGGHERRAEEHQENQDVGECTRTLGGLRQQPEEYGHPCRGECEQGQEADEPQPSSNSGGRPEPDKERHHNHDGRGEQVR
jgi:hypothetical protein